MSDILYIVYVPAYNPVIKVLLVVFLLPPPILSCISASGNVKETIATFLGVLPLYKYIYEGRNNLEALENQAESGQGALFILEDGP